MKETRFIDYMTFKKITMILILISNRCHYEEERKYQEYVLQSGGTQIGLAVLYLQCKLSWSWASLILRSYFAGSWKTLESTTGCFRSCSFLLQLPLCQRTERENYLNPPTLSHWVRFAFCIFVTACLLGLSWQRLASSCIINSACVNIPRAPRVLETYLSLSLIPFIHSSSRIWQDELN